MIEKVNISQVMNQYQIVADADYVYVEKGNSQGKIKKSDLDSDLNNNFATITAEIEKLKAANVKFKGYYTTELTLKAAHPSPTVGDNAWVGAEYPGTVYECKTAGTWSNTAKAPSTPSVQLADYATKNLLDVRTTEYNVSVQHPTSGLDGTNKYTLSRAIALVPLPLRTIGLKCSFLGDAGTLQTWEYQGGIFKTVGNWVEQVRRTELSELNNKANSVFFTDSYYGNRIIKELFLKGCSENEQYLIYLSKGNDFQITRMSDSTLVARAGAGLNYALFHKVVAINNSGITGYVVFDWNNWDDNWIVHGGNTNVPKTYITKQAYEHIDLCPIIKMFLNYETKEDIDSLSISLLNDIRYTYAFNLFTANLVDSQKLENGYLYDGGTVNPHDVYKCITYFIPVKPGGLYKFNNLETRFCYLYDQRLNYISGIDSYLQEKVLTIPDGCYYVRLSFINANNCSFINDGDWDYTYDGYLEYGKFIPKNIDFSNTEIPLKDNTVTPSACTFFSTGKNLYNENDPDFAYGYYLHLSTGLATNANSSYKTSGYIPITKEQIGKYVNVSNNGSRIQTRFYVFCDSEKKVIESASSQTYKAYLIPENAAYYRCTVNVSKTKVQVEISDVESVTSYSPYKLSISNDYLPDDIGGDSIQVFLPSEICIAVGRTIELYNKQVAFCGNYNNFHFKYTATNSGGQSIGTLYVDKFSIPATSSAQVGEYNLILEVLDNNLNTVATANSIIKIVDKPSNLSPQNLLMVGDSLGNKPWLPEIRKLANDIFGEQKITWVGTLNAYAGIDNGNAYPGYGEFCKNEGRSGWTAGYYISDGAKFTQIILNVTGVTEAPARKKQYYIPAKEGGNMTYEVEEVLNENGLPYEDNGGTISKISMNQVVNSWNTPDGQATGGTITAKDTSQAGDNSINYTSWETPNSNPFWNPTGGDGSGAVDFNWYFEQNGIPIPSFMFTMLGMNGHNADDLYEFIRLYREQVPSSGVIAMIPHFIGSINIDLLSKKTIFDFNVAICDKLKGMEKVYIAPVFITHDSNHNFFNGEENVNPRNDSIKIPSLADIVHPQNPGYMQYADIGFSTWMAHSKR